MDLSEYDGVWDGKKVKSFGDDLTTWDFPEESPWIGMLDNDKLYIVVTDGNFIDDEWKSVCAGVDLDDVIDWFLVDPDGMEDDEDRIAEKKSAIKALERAIEKIKATL